MVRRYHDVKDYITNSESTVHRPFLRFYAWKGSGVSTVKQLRLSAIWKRTVRIHSKQDLELFPLTSTLEFWRVLYGGTREETLEIPSGNFT